jgi:hypothetical protein
VSRVAAIGELEAVEGYGLAGVELLPAAGPGALQEAWASLPADVALLLLTPAAAAELGGRLAEAGDLLWVVIPE